MMKYIAIKKYSDLQKLIDKSDQIVPSTDINDIWMICLDYPTITLQQLQETLTALLQKIQENIKRPVTFYMWFDQMALQLRFNVIEGYCTNLPFGCIINKTESPDAVVKEFFLYNQHQEITWQEMEKTDTEGSEPSPFVLTVFYKYL